MNSGFHVWGMQPASYIAFTILLSFAAFAVILDRNGFKMVDQDGERQSVIPHYLGLGAGIGMIVLVGTKWIQLIIY